MLYLLNLLARSVLANFMWSRGGVKLHQVTSPSSEIKTLNCLSWGAWETRNQSHSIRSSFFQACARHYNALYIKVRLGLEFHANCWKSQMRFQHLHHVGATVSLQRRALGVHCGFSWVFTCWSTRQGSLAWIWRHGRWPSSPVMPFLGATCTVPGALVDFTKRLS